MTFGVLGSRVGDAKRAEFFTWFHLEETERVAQGALTNLKFRPTSEQFHDLVAVEMLVDKNEQLQSVTLSIQRAFIDHRQQFTFAADITKSFLVAALDRKDIEMIGEAAMQIRRYHPTISEMVTVSSRAPSRPPLAPGEGETEFLVYAGKRRTVERKLKTAHLTMANGPVNGEQFLRITIIHK
jgi:hypothetical protein